MDAFVKGFGAVILILMLLVFISLLMAYPTMWLVNALFAHSVITALFGVPTLSLGKALMLNILCGFLFKSSSVSK